jgi:rare lipoprotein A
MPYLCSPIHDMNKLLLILLIFIGCSFIPKTEYSQTGRASFYANKFHGRKTSSGEIFKQENLTAAHKTLPFGTLVKVLNLSNDSIVIVKINDRLSKSSPSLIDLSLQAAKQLNFIRFGHAKVKVESL